MEEAGTRRGAAPLLPPVAGRVDEDRREECDRGVEIQHRRHCHDEHDGTDVEGQPIRCQASERVSGSGEQPILVGDETHQEEARHEDEWGPVLCCGGPGFIGAEERGGERSDTPKGRQPPPEPTSGSGGRSRVRTVAHRRKHARIRSKSNRSQLPGTSGTRLDCRHLTMEGALHQPLDPSAQYGRAGGPLRPPQRTPQPPRPPRPRRATAGGWCTTRVPGRSDIRFMARSRSECVASPGPRRASGTGWRAAYGTPRDWGRPWWTWGRRMAGLGNSAADLGPARSRQIVIRAVVGAQPRVLHVETDDPGEWNRWVVRYLNLGTLASARLLRQEV